MRAFRLGILVLMAAGLAASAAAVDRRQEAVPTSPGTALLKRLSTFLEMSNAGVFAADAASLALDDIKTAAIQAKDKNEIRPLFFDRFARVLNVVRLVIATSPNDPGAADAEKEIGRLVKDVLGEEWNAQAPVSEQIARFSRAVAAEMVSLQKTLASPSGPQGDSGPPLRAGGEIQPPRLIREIKPVYPELALRARIEGVVIVEILVDARGNVKDAKVLSSIPLLDQAALDAVKQWKYEPIVVDGKARDVIATVTVEFSLK
jgi:TonB family protein